MVDEITKIRESMERLELRSKNHANDNQLAFQVNLKPVQDKVDDIASGLDGRFAPVSATLSTIATAVVTFKDVLGQILHFLGSFHTETRMAFQRVIQTNMQIYALLLHAQNNLHTSPSMLTESILFEDALGRTSALPYQWFRHWEVSFTKGKTRKIKEC